MSPDIDWHVGEDDEHETVVTSTPAHRSRRRWWLLAMAVALGVSLGVVYRSLPELVPRPTPSPSPTPQPTRTYPAIPVKLYATIDREAQALADGDVESYFALQASRTRRNGFDDLSAWGRPPDAEPLYTITNYNLRTPDKAWVDIRQFRNGRWFRVTRFYQFDAKEDRWLRSDPDPFFWSGQTAVLDTPHLHVIYAVEDRESIGSVTTQLENVHSRLCAYLGCPLTGITYTLKLDSGLNAGWPISDDGREIRFPSPHVMGIYEEANPIGLQGRNLAFLMASSIVQRITGRSLFDPGLQRAKDVMLSIMTWRAAEFALDMPLDTQIASFQNPLPLAELWQKPDRSAPAEIDFREAYPVIYFTEQAYGAQSMPQLLKTLDTATSFTDLIERGLGVPFAEFDQKWQAWLKSRTP